MSKENLVDLILNNYDEFVLQHEANSDMDISEADFSHTNIENADFTNIDFLSLRFYNIIHKENCYG